MRGRQRAWAGTASLLALMATGTAARAQTTPGPVAAGSPPAAAPDASPPSPAPDAAPSGDIVVTAQGRTQRLQDVPISASVLSGAAVQSANLRNLEELGARVPAVKITAGPASDLINIRGVGSGLNAGFEQSVATFVDGVYRGRSRSSRAALFDIDRVEILKGPQTTFFGNNAIAGALNIATRRPNPGEALRYNASALYAPADGEFGFEAGLSAPVTERLALRAAGKYFGMNGYVHNSYIDADGPHQRDFVGRVSLAWEPADALRSDLRVDYGRFRDRNFFPNEVVDCPAQTPPYPTPRGLCAQYLAVAGAGADDTLNARSQGAPSNSTFDYWETALTNRLKLGSHTLRAVTSYYHHDVASLVQLAPLPLGGVGGRNSPFPNASPETYHSFSQELRLESPVGKPFEYLAGAYFSSDDLTASQITGSYFAPFGANAPGYTTAATPIAARLFQTQQDKTYSVFAAGTLHLGDALRINGGLRYSIVHKHAHRESMLGIGQDDPSVDFVALPDAAQALIRRALGGRAGEFARTSRTDRKLMPSASIQYDLASTLMAYASYTKGFKAGGFALSPNADIFDPETVDAYEVGLKGGLFDRRVTFSLAGFLSDYDNLQESTNVVLPSGVIQSVVGNVAKARSKGVEFGMTARIVRGLSLNADLGYLDARYRRYPGAPCTIQQALTASPCSQDLSGARRAYSPKFSGSVGANAIIPAGALEVRLDPALTFTSRYFQQASADPLTLQKGYAKVDVRLGIGPRGGRWEVAVIGKNLNDRITGSFRNNIPTTPGTTYALTDRPRSVAVQLSIRN